MKMIAGSKKLLLLGLSAVLLLSGCGRLATSGLPGDDLLPGSLPVSEAFSTPETASIPEPDSSRQESATSSGVPDLPEGTYEAIPLPEEMRAMWIAYPDLEDEDLTNADSLRRMAHVMFDECKDLGLNTVIFIVRPFSDAIYPSGIFPWSYLVGGDQGIVPDYDPLEILIEEAHGRGLRFEAYINPYRVRLEGKFDTMDGSNPARVNSSWSKEVGESEWYDPGLPEVREIVVAGVREIVENYDVDGIHFDDYFYPDFEAYGVPDEDEDFDAESYTLYGGGVTRGDWRRQNVNMLMGEVYDTIKAVNPTVSFGISPAGNNENNYNKLYSDINHWIQTEGYVDYIMPQLYWEIGYTLQSGSDRYAFENITLEWAGYARLDSVKLYAGLAAYKIGTNDAWNTGHELADEVALLRTIDGFDGFAVFRYYSLYENDGVLERGQEVEALRGVLTA